MALDRLFAYHSSNQDAIPLAVVYFLEAQDDLDVSGMDRHWGWAVTPKVYDVEFGEKVVADDWGIAEASSDARRRQAP